MWVLTYDIDTGNWNTLMPSRKKNLVEVEKMCNIRNAVLPAVSLVIPLDAYLLLLPVYSSCIFIPQHCGPVTL